MNAKKVGQQVEGKSPFPLPKLGRQRTGQRTVMLRFYKSGSSLPTALLVMAAGLLSACGGGSAFGPAAKSLVDRHSFSDRFRNRSSGHDVLQDSDDDQ